MYYLYILECSDKSLYTGITTDVKRRLREHNNSSLGSKYTRSRRPVSLVFSIVFANRTEASKVEFQVKKMTHAEKLELVNLEVIYFP